MPVIKLTLSQEGYDALAAMAAKKELPLSLWARSALLDLASARGGESAKPEKYMWLGKECTREVYEAGMARKAATMAGIADLPSVDPEVAREIAEPEPRRKHKK